MLKMSLGPDDVSSKNVTFYGGIGPQYQHGQGSRNSSISPQGNHHSLKFTTHPDGMRQGKPIGQIVQGKQNDGQGAHHLKIDAALAGEHAILRADAI
jgi:hypothetical protein